MLEELVALDAKSGHAFEFLKFGNPYRAEFRAAHAEIAKPPGDVFVFGIKFREEPGLRPGGIEQLDDGPEIFPGIGAFDGRLFAAIGDQLVADFLGQEFS